jgi:IS30 family transposase
MGRELAHNTITLQDYGSHHAQLRAARGSGKLHQQSVCWGVVKTILGWKWSPQQIDIAYPQVGLPSSIRVPGVPRNHLYRYLCPCQGRTASRAHRLSGPWAHYASATQPWHRPPWPDSRDGQHPRASPQVEDRVMPGHWEGDFINGAGNKSSVGALVERSRRLVLLARMEEPLSPRRWPALLPSSMPSVRRCARA